MPANKKNNKRQDKDVADTVRRGGLDALAAMRGEEMSDVPMMDIDEADTNNHLELGNILNDAGTVKKTAKKNRARKKKKAIEKSEELSLAIDDEEEKIIIDETKAQKDKLDKLKKIRKKRLESISKGKTSIFGMGAMAMVSPSTAALIGIASGGLGKLAETRKNRLEESLAKIEEKEEKFSNNTPKTNTDKLEPLIPETPKDTNDSVVFSSEPLERIYTKQKETVEKLESIEGILSDQHKIEVERIREKEQTEDRNIERVREIGFDKHPKAQNKRVQNRRRSGVLGNIMNRGRNGVPGAQGLLRTLGLGAAGGVVGTLMTKIGLLSGAVGSLSAAIPPITLALGALAGSRFLHNLVDRQIETNYGNDRNRHIILNEFGNLRNYQEHIEERGLEHNAETANTIIQERNLGVENETRSQEQLETINSLKRNTDLSDEIINRLVTMFPDEGSSAIRSRFTQFTNRSEDTEKGFLGSPILSDSNAELFLDSLGETRAPMERETFTGERVINPELGSIAARYESGNAGVASVSSGVNDPGGVSYGTYQLSSNMNTVQDWMSSEGSEIASQYGLDQHRPGSPEFTERYLRAAQEQPEELHRTQHEYIYRTHYLPVLTEAERAGFDVSNPGISQALWSQSVQHGFGGNQNILRNANPEGTPLEQLSSLQESRTRYVSGLTSLTPGTIESIRNRYSNEYSELAEITRQPVRSNVLNQQSETLRMAESSVSRQPVFIDASRNNRGSGRGQSNNSTTIVNGGDKEDISIRRVTNMIAAKGLAR